MDLNEDESRSVLQKIRVSTELSTSTMVFLFDRIQMIGAHPPLTLTILSNLIEMNLNKMLEDDAKTYLKEHPEISMDVKESVEQGIEKLQELFDAFKKDGGVTTREVETQ